MRRDIGVPLLWLCSKNRITGIRQLEQVLLSQRFVSIVASGSGECRCRGSAQNHDFPVDSVYGSTWLFENQSRKPPIKRFEPSCRLGSVPKVEPEPRLSRGFRGQRPAAADILLRCHEEVAHIWPLSIRGEPPLFHLSPQYSRSQATVTLRLEDTNGRPIFLVPYFHCQQFAFCSEMATYLSAGGVNPFKQAPRDPAAKYSVFVKPPRDQRPKTAGDWRPAITKRYPQKWMIVL